MQLPRFARLTLGALVAAPLLCGPLLALSPTAAQAAPPVGTSGYDVSYPQCNGPLPGGGAFAIVGVNNGIVYSPNPCLATELAAYGAGPTTGLYANTGNPGPALSSHWPIGQTTPKACTGPNYDTPECAYDYGWNAAKDSFADAATAFAADGFVNPAGHDWWLDVEIANSWRDVATNVATLHGAADSLAASGVTFVGFYSSTGDWQTITGSTLEFNGFPSWIPGAADAVSAQSLCAGPSLTGSGTPTLTQYVSGGYDVDVACGGPAPAPAPSPGPPPAPSPSGDDT
ncbi:MAG: hypothetical protein NVSMB12_20740 [Acidimicrobiales bacterium]